MKAKLQKKSTQTRYILVVPPSDWGTQYMVIPRNGGRPYSVRHRDADLSQISYPSRSEAEMAWHPYSQWGSWREVVVQSIEVPTMVAAALTQDQITGIIGAALGYTAVEAGVISVCESLRLLGISGLDDQHGEWIDDLLSTINDNARAWKWRDVESALDDAYAFFGGHNDWTGYAYHCGEHPVQRVAEQASPL